jgi:FkbM family methyltransferase
MDHRFRCRLFAAVGRLSCHLPPIRGRTRLFLEVFRALGLARGHCVVQAHLRHPAPYHAILDLHSWLQRIAFLTGGYEPDTVRFLLRLHLRTGSSGYLLDVGANIGLLAIPFALLAQGGGLPRVVAVEAAPDNASRLRENVALNALEAAIRVIGVALGDRQKTVAIQVEGDLDAGAGTGTANILPDGSMFPCVRQPLSLMTLDGLYASRIVPPGCAVAKIDTDGYDLKVLRGAQAFLAAERPIVFGEFAAHCLGWHGESLQDVIEFASVCDYRVWRKDTGSWCFSENPRVDGFQSDLLLVPNERADSLRELIRT